jgi:hypothetical protein
MKRCLKITVLALTVCIAVVARSHGADPPKLSGSYMLQNKATGLMLRPEGAYSSDGTTMVLFQKRNWACLTYTFTANESGGYTLKNHYTHKTFQPTKKGASQIAIGDVKVPFWLIEPVGDDGYYIKDPETGRVLSAPSAEAKQNAAVVLEKAADKTTQIWQLVRRSQK